MPMAQHVPGLHSFREHDSVESSRQIYEVGALIPTAPETHLTQAKCSSSPSRSHSWCAAKPHQPHHHTCVPTASRLFPFGNFHAPGLDVSAKMTQ